MCCARSRVDKSKVLPGSHDSETGALSTAAFFFLLLLRRVVDVQIGDRVAQTGGSGAAGWARSLVLDILRIELHEEFDVVFVPELGAALVTQVLDARINARRLEGESLRAAIVEAAECPASEAHLLGGRLVEELSRPRVVAWSNN